MKSGTYILLYTSLMKSKYFGFFLVNHVFGQKNIAHFCFHKILGMFFLSPCTFYFKNLEHFNWTCSLKYDIYYYIIHVYYESFIKPAFLFSNFGWCSNADVCRNVWMLVPKRQNVVVPKRPASPLWSACFYLIFNITDLLFTTGSILQNQNCLKDKSWLM